MASAALGSNGILSFGINEISLGPYNERFGNSIQSLKDFTLPTDTIAVRDFTRDIVFPDNPSPSLPCNLQLVSHMRSWSKCLPVPLIPIGSLDGSGLPTLILSPDQIRSANSERNRADRDKYVGDPIVDYDRKIYSEIQADLNSRDNNQVVTTVGIPHECGDPLPAIKFEDYDPITNKFNGQNSLSCDILAGRRGPANEFGIKRFLRSLLISAHAHDDQLDPNNFNSEALTNPARALGQLSNYWQLKSHVKLDQSRPLPKILEMMQKSGGQTIANVLKSLDAAKLSQLAECYKPTMAPPTNMAKAVDVCRGIIWERLDGTYTKLLRDLLPDDALVCSRNMKIEEHPILFAPVLKEFVNSLDTTRAKLGKKYPDDWYYINEAIEAFQAGKYRVKKKLEDTVLQEGIIRAKEHRYGQGSDLTREISPKMRKQIVDESILAFRANEERHLIKLRRILDEVLGLPPFGSAGEQRGSIMDLKTALLSQRKKDVSSCDITKLAPVVDLEYILRKWSRYFLDSLMSRGTAPKLHEQIAKCLAFYIGRSMIRNVIEFSRDIWQRGLLSDEPVLCVGQGLLSMGEFGPLLDSISRALKLCVVVSKSGAFWPEVISAPDCKCPFAWILHTVNYGERSEKMPPLINEREFVPMMIAKHKERPTPISPIDLANRFGFNLTDTKFTPQGNPGTLKLVDEPDGLRPIFSV